MTKCPTPDPIAREFPDPFESKFARDIYEARYRLPGETWHDTATRVVTHVLGAVGLQDSPEAGRLIELIYQRKFMPGGRYLSNSGRELHQTQNCMLLRAEDTREGWADLCHKSMMALMTGAGIGVDYSEVREAGAAIKRTGGVASGPLPLMHSVNELGRGAVQGGKRRAAIWAGLSWWHPDVFEFIKSKDWDTPYELPDGSTTTVKDIKEKNFTFAAPMDMTNISVILDDTFFWAYESYGAGEGLADGLGPCPDERGWHWWAKEVYDQTVEHMLTTAEPGFSVNYENPRESLRNACTEITSEDDSDVCNLGSIVLPRIAGKEELAEVTELATLFLIAGTVYSDLPYEKVHEVREKNRRLGLGHMGEHEWLLRRGKRYGEDAELGEWLDTYEQVSDAAGAAWADRLGLSRPVKIRAIAPNGTIGILAETTTSAEPIFAAAYKRRVYNNEAHGDDTSKYQYVVDPVAKRLIESGVEASAIEDAYTLSFDPERRIAFQAWNQQWIDHGISSTINLPSAENQIFTPKEFGEILYKYLPKLRGITCYPDGCRGGQPLTSVAITEALEKEGVVFEENEEACIGGLCGV